MLEERQTPRDRGAEPGPPADPGSGGSGGTPSLHLLSGEDRLLAGRRGRGVDVAILDSGVNPAHPHVGGIATSRALDDYGDPHPDPLDRLGHGTAVTAAIHEKAPEAHLHILKVFHTTLSSTILALVRAMDLASSEGIRLINLSLGTLKEDHAPLLQEAVNRARTRGCLVVSPRERDGRVWFPGALDGVVAVIMDPGCPRDGLRFRGDVPGLRVYASGYPRPIPGIPPERNLNGVSFSVANATGVLARLLQDRPGITDVEGLRTLLLQEGERT